MIGRIRNYSKQLFLNCFYVNEVIFETQNARGIEQCPVTQSVEQRHA